MHPLGTLLESVAAHGGHLVVHGTGIKVVAPVPLPTDLIETLRVHKAALRELLLDEETHVSTKTAGHPTSDVQGTSRTSRTSETSPAGPQTQVGDAPIDVETARAHLTILLTAIHEGCRRGLAQHLERTPAEMTRALLANAGGLSLEQWRERCEQAGEAVTLAGLVADYRDRLRQLEALGGDIFPDAAALELALLMGDDPPGEMRP